MTVTTCYRTTAGTICQTLEDAEVQDAAERLSAECSGVPGVNAQSLARCLSYLLRQGLIETERHAAGGQHGLKSVA